MLAGLVSSGLVGPTRSRARRTTLVLTSRASIGTTAAVSASFGMTVLSVGTNTTAAAGGVLFYDTTLYRYGSAGLRTGGVFSAVTAINSPKYRNYANTVCMSHETGGALYIGGDSTGAEQAGTVTFKNSGDVTVPTNLYGQTNIVVGTAAVATNATDGYAYGATCAGTPTGTPTAQTGRAASVYDSTNDKFYADNAGWKFIGGPGTGFQCILNGTLANATYKMVVYATSACIIRTFRQVQSTSGTGTVAVKINGTSVTGLGTIAVTSTPQDVTATAANVVAKGDAITFVISSVSSMVDLFGALLVDKT